MKVLKSSVLLILISLITSCSENEEEFSFVGIWNLDTFLISNSAFGSNQYNFTETIQPDEDCLYESTLTIFPDNTALFKLTSTITNSLQVVDGTTDEVEQIVTCENVVEETYFIWATGDYREINEDGSVTTSSSEGYNTIRFIDENGDVVMGGFVGFDNNLNINTSNGIDSRIYLEVDGEEIEFIDLQILVFNRS